MRKHRTRICQHCAKTFLPSCKRGPLPKYCSKQCRWAAGIVIATNRALPQVCKQCGKMFQKVGQSDFCSRLCYLLSEGWAPVEPRLCLSCAKTFKPAHNKAQYCSRACVDVRPKTAKDCIRCGKQYQPTNGNQLYCSKECYKAEPYRVKRECLCKFCGRNFRPKNSDRTSFCSREHSFVYKKIRRSFARYSQGVRDHLSRNRRGIPKSRYCSFCGSMYCSPGSTSKYCSIECGMRANKKKKRADWAIYSANRPQEQRECKECGGGFTINIGNTYRRFCSERCGNRFYNRQRRGNYWGNYIAPVVLSDIVERDGGRCMLCGEMVNMEVLSLDRMGATIDHIIPLSRGGTHEPNNCQLAHRGCNSKKGAPKAIQLEIIPPIRATA